MAFSDLRGEIKSHFIEASSFLGKNKMGLIVRGRNLSEEEEQEVMQIIADNTQLTITCIIDEESETERLFNMRSQQDKIQEADDHTSPADTNTTDISTDCDNNAQVLVGNLRSGQDVSCKQNVVILGDVKPGASVTSYGSIFILGELRGNAFAGAGGDHGAIVMALKLNPLQVRIADAIAISPDAEKGPKLKFKKKRLKTDENEPEVAYIENGHIVKTSYGPSFLRQFSK